MGNEGGVLHGGQIVKEWIALMLVFEEKSLFIMQDLSIIIYGVLYSPCFYDFNICKRPKSRETQQYLVLSNLPYMTLDVMVILRKFFS